MAKGEARNAVEDTQQGWGCPECGGVVETIMVEDVYRYGTGAAEVALPVTLPVRHCKACGFEFLDDAAERAKREALCNHFGVLTPWEIRDIRKGYGLSRAEFSRLTGIGEASLGRWETGVLIQTLANDRYLRLLAQPGGVDALKEVLESA